MTDLREALTKLAESASRIACIHRYTDEALSWGRLPHEAAMFLRAIEDARALLAADERRQQQTSRSLGAERQSPTNGSDAGCDGIRARLEAAAARWHADSSERRQRASRTEDVTERGILYCEAAMRWDCIRDVRAILAEDSMRPRTTAVAARTESADATNPGDEGFLKSAVSSSGGPVGDR